ncbi:MAG: hypothetical protein K9M80_08995 [Candidatus Marinimicrobia bacterium]|nr:hypothetical protein [Candidatus Neomarinimicrobiota bacterium]
MHLFQPFKTLYLLAYLITLLFINFACSSQQDYKAPELIEMWKIEPGTTNKIDMDKVFYADNYKLEFSENQNLQLNYKSISNSLLIRPDTGFAGLNFLNFTNAGRELILPILVEKKIPVTFTYKPESSVSDVYLMGNFNTWQRNDITMTDPDRDGIFSATIKLNPGVYKYQFIVDQKEIWDPHNPDKIPNGFGSYNSIVRVKNPNKSNVPHVYFKPASANLVKVHIDAAKYDEQLQIYILKNNDFLPKRFYTLEKDKLHIELDKIGNGNDILRIIPVYNNEPGNILKIWINNGKVIDNEEFIWQDATIYSLMVDRFNNSNPENDEPVEHPDLAHQANFQGGDIEGLIKKIKSGYFDQLGINTIWLSPIFETTDQAYQEWPEPHRYFTGYHGYWPVSLTKVEPRFGSLEQFKKLVKIAHQHKIKILLDFVSNHVHKEHPWFKQHRDWFGNYELPGGRKNIRKWNEYRLTTWFDTFLPSFDYMNSEAALDTVTNIALEWLQNTNIDGFRHDATKHLPDEFWQTLTRESKAKVDPFRNDKIFQIGESFGSYEFIKSYVNNGMLDSQFNFELFFTLRRIFVEENSDFADLKMALDKSLSIYGYNNLMGNIMDSHDQVRIMAYLDGDLDLSDNGTERAWQKPKIKVNNPEAYQKQRMVMTFLLTIPGVPIVYYGDEFGMTGANDPDNRRMMKFDSELDSLQQKQLTHISRLINIRKEYSAIRRGDYLPLKIDKDVFIYSRGDQKHRLIIAINKSNQKQSISTKLPDWLEYNSVNSLIDTTEYNINNNLFEHVLEPYSAQIFKLES